MADARAGAGPGISVELHGGVKRSGNVCAVDAASLKVDAGEFLIKGNPTKRLQWIAGATRLVYVGGLRD